MAKTNGSTILNNLVQGRMVDDFEVPPRVVRIYVCSSFSDFVVERQKLWQEVLPELQRTYRQYGLEIQLVDPYQGALYDHVIDRQLFNLHLSEISECHRLSEGPFFLCFVGNKYKPCPLPEYIEISEYKHIKNEAFEAGKDVKLLDDWYPLDENSVPARHVLCPINTKLKYFHNRSPSSPGLCERDITEWQSTIVKLQDIIQYGSTMAHQEGLINQIHPYKQDRFSLSAMDEQIQHALQAMPKRCMFFMRNFENIDYTHQTATLYCDVLHEERNKFLYQKQSHLRDRIHLNLTSTGNINYYNIPWCADGLNAEENIHHSEYIHQLVSDIIKTIGSCIEGSFNRENILPGLLSDIKSRRMYTELMVHTKHCVQLEKEKLEGFDCLLDRIKGLLVHGSRGEHQGVLVHGPHGAGKSAFLAKVSKIAVSLFGSDAILVTRFVGLSRDSETNEDILHSICWQLNKALNQKMSLRCYSLSSLLSCFKALVNLASKMSRQVILIMDGIDRIKSKSVHESPTPEWLYGKFLSKMHVVMSCTTPQDNEELTELNNQFTNKDFILELTPLPEAKVLELMKSVLSTKNRTVSKAQQRYVLQAAEQSTVPLWVHTVCHRIKSWMSKSPVRVPIPSAVTELIQSHFVHMERQWGCELFSTIVGYLTMASYGLTESELLDLLSSNNEVLLLVYPTSVPSVLRFPQFLWLQIKNDLGSFLCERFVDEHIVLAWRHQCIREVIMKRYFTSPSSKVKLHTAISDLFLENSFNNNWLVSRSEKMGVCQRFLSPQPLILSSSVYNLRRLNELWLQLLHAGNHENFKENSFCNFEYLLAKVHSLSVVDVIGQLEYTLHHYIDKELLLVLESMKMSEDILIQDPLQLACELIGRLRQTKDYYPQNIDSLVTQCMQWCDSFSSPLFVPLTAWLPPTIPTLVSSWSSPNVVGPIAVMVDNQAVFCVTNAHEVHMYNVPAKKLVKKFTGHTKSIHCLTLAHCSNWFVTGSEDWTVRMFDISTGSNTLTMKDHSDGVLCMALTKDDKLLVTGSKDYSVKITLLSSMAVQQTVMGHLGPITSVVLNSADTILVTGSADGAIRLWFLEDMCPMSTVEDLPTPVMCLAVSIDNIFLVAGCEDGSLVVKSLTTGTDVHQLKGHGGRITEVVIDRDSHHVVAGSDDGQVYLYNLRTQELLQVFTSDARHGTARLTVSNNNEFIFSVSYNQINVWNLCKRYTNKAPDDNHNAAVTSITISKDGSCDNLVKLWNLDTSNLLENLIGHECSVTCVGIAPDEAFVVSGSESGTIKIWSVIMGTVVTDYDGHNSAISHISVLNDSLRVLSAETAGVIHVWKADNAEVLLVCNGPTNLVTVSSNDMWATSGAGDESLTIWKVDNGDCVQKITHSDIITCVQFSDNAQYVITGSADMSLKVWETVSGKLTQVLVEHENCVSCVAITHNNKYIVSGSHDKNLIIWTLDTGAVEYKLLGHNRVITVVRLTTDGTVAISGSKDGSLRAWCMKTGSCLTIFDMHEPVVNVKITSNVNHMVVMLENCRHLPLMCLHNSPAQSSDRMHSLVSVKCEEQDNLPGNTNVLPIRPKTATTSNHVTSLPPTKLTTRQSSVATLPEYTAVPIIKAPLQKAVKAQEEKTKKKRNRPKTSQTSEGSSSSGGNVGSANRTKSNLCHIL